MIGLMQEFSEYRSCELCPRLCRVDRRSKTGAAKEAAAGAAAAPGGPAWKRGPGFCRQSDRLILACATRHFGEEPPLTGEGGSGALFFSGCTLRCGYCQNRQLSRSETGEAVSPEELAELCLRLQAEGAENINLVSGTPFIPSIEWAVRRARREGLRIPVVWNSSGYETLEAVRRLSGFVDIFLPDLKLLDPGLSGRLLSARDYPDAAKAAVLEMAAASRPVFEGEKMRSGTIVRHLVLPGLMNETRKVLEWFSTNIGDRALMSLMVQFFVPGEIRGWQRGVSKLKSRRLTEREYDTLLAWLEEFGIEEGFIQEPGDEENWWPDFTRRNPFPGEYSKVLWSCGKD